MSINVKDIENAALHLSMQERAQLVQTLLDSLDRLPDAEARQLWLAEAGRRATEIDSGKAQLLSGEEFENQLQALFK